jgi:hypothetical protein
MFCFHGHVRLVSLLFASVLILGTSACNRIGQTYEEDRVTGAFEAWKEAMINHQTDQAMAYIPSHVDAYLSALNSAAGNSVSAPNEPPSASPGVDLLVRTALQKKVPADLRSKLTFAALMQRLTDKNLISAHDMQQIALGHVSVNGNRASAELYYQGTLTALRLPFIKEDDGWKIDVLSLLPYAEVLMRVDRAMKGQTQAQQVDQLVSKLPAL